MRRAGAAAETARRVDVAAEVDLAARRVLEVAATARVGTTADERMDVAEATEVAACDTLDPSAPAAVLEPGRSPALTASPTAHSTKSRHIKNHIDNLLSTLKKRQSHEKAEGRAQI